MKVLYIGVYRDGTGWAEAATQYILSMDAVGIEVVPRAIRLNNNNFPIHPRVEELESKSPVGCDVVIQHLLPHMFVKVGDIPNIGIYEQETCCEPKSMNWRYYLEMMDDIWSPNSIQHNIVKEIVPKCELIPHATDVSKFDEAYELIDFGNDFKFYFVGEFHERKNLPALIKAFHTEFDPSEPVSLVIKTGVPGRAPEEGHAIISDLCNKIKQGLRLRNNYKVEKIITHRVSENDLYRLHNTCDCFVMPSKGEALCFPALDAMGFGNPAICTENTGMADFCDIPVKARIENCFACFTAVGDMYNSNEQWMEIDVPDLQRKMREAYNNRGNHTSKTDWVKKNYNHERIGTLIKDRLCQTL